MARLKIGYNRNDKQIVPNGMFKPFMGFGAMPIAA